MKRSEVLQEVRKMRFEEAYGGWKRGRLTQQEPAGLLGVCERTFRRYLLRYEEEGMQGLVDRRLGQLSHRRGVGGKLRSSRNQQSVSFEKKPCFCAKKPHCWLQKAVQKLIEPSWSRPYRQSTGHNMRTDATDVSTDATIRCFLKPTPLEPVIIMRSSIGNKHCEKRIVLGGRG